MLKARSQLQQISSGIGVAREDYSQQREEGKRRLDDLDHSAAMIETAGVLYARYAEQIDSARPTISVADRVKDLGAWASSSTRSFCNAELLAIDDTIEVDGQKISGTRWATVGKVLSAIGILVLGYSLVKFAPMQSDPGGGSSIQD